MGQDPLKILRSYLKLLFVLVVFSQESKSFLGISSSNRSPTSQHHSYMSHPLLFSLLRQGPQAGFSRYLVIFILLILGHNNDSMSVQSYPLIGIRVVKANKSPKSKTHEWVLVLQQNIGYYIQYRRPQIRLVVCCFLEPCVSPAGFDAANRMSKQCIGIESKHKWIQW